MLAWLGAGGWSLRGGDWRILCGRVDVSSDGRCIESGTVSFEPAATGPRVRPVRYSNGHTGHCAAGSENDFSGGIPGEVGESDANAVSVLRVNRWLWRAIGDSDARFCSPRISIQWKT